MWAGEGGLYPADAYDPASEERRHGLTQQAALLEDLRHERNLRQAAEARQVAMDAEMAQWRDLVTLLKQRME